MPVSSDKLREMYDRISLRVTKGYKAKFETLARAAGLRPTAYLEWLFDEAQKKSTKPKKKDPSQG